MEVKRIIVGPIRTNCYILNKDKECLIIDPGDEAERIKKEITNKVIGILITHHHFDHVGALEELKDFYQVPVYDYNNLKEKNYKIGNFNFEVLYTFGHTSDSITFYFKDDKKMFGGDFIFKNSIGRTDLPTGNMKDMLKSIEKLKKYNDNIIIYPGHGENTDLNYEKENNVYF